MNTTIEVSLALIPVLPLCGGAACGLLPGESGARVSRAAAWAVAVLAAVAAGALAFGPAIGSAAGGLLMLDGVSASMSLLVAVLGLAVVRFSVNTLRGDAQAGRFWRNLNLCLGLTQVLVLAGSLPVLAVGWIGSSLALHGLLLHFRDRGEARLAAWTKFLISRTGDACLLAGILVLHAAAGTWSIAGLAAWAANAPAQVPAAACGLFAACALLKSVQVPFHSWLPDALETPSSVSALMHAGVVNAGGFLLIRLSPVLVAAPSVLAVVVAVGCFTVLFGSVVLAAQTSVKRRLAYSTVAQMGFMMVECGLGAFGLALLHLLAHSAYKAHAFLRSGTAAGEPRPGLPVVKAWAVFAGLAVAAALVAAARWGASLAGLPDGQAVFDLVLGLGVAYGLAAAFSAGLRGGALLVALLGVAVAQTAHEAGLALWALPTASAAVGASAAVASVTFALLFALQLVLPHLAARPAGRALHVHALNGFYLAAWTRRLMRRFGPVRNGV